MSTLYKHGLLTLLMFGFSGSLALAKPVVDKQAKRLLDQVGSKLQSADEISVVEMKIIEPDGSSKTRKMEIKSKTSGDQQKTLVRLEGPPDLKGTAFLSHLKADSENQWIYLPSQKKVRRVIGGGGQQGVLGSELSYEDLNPSMIRSSSVSLRPGKKVGGKNYQIVETVPEKGQSQYSRVLTWVEGVTHLPARVEYFAEGQSPIKVVSLRKYKKFGPKTWRAQSVLVENRLNRRRTEIAIVSLKANSGLGDSEFSPQALED